MKHASQKNRQQGRRKGPHVVGNVQNLDQRRRKNTFGCEMNRYRRISSPLSNDATVYHYHHQQTLFKLPPTRKRKQQTTNAANETVKCAGATL